MQANPSFLNSLSAVVSLLEVTFTCCVLGEAVSARHRFSSAADNFRLVLELLGWEIPSLAIENSLFQACSFIP